jgi:putative peptidoglycan lipid II flippase
VVSGLRWSRQSAGVTEPGLEADAAVSVATDPARPKRVLGQVGGSTAILTVAALGGQVAGLIRELYIAYRVGASASLDALLVAVVLPVLVSGLLTSGLRAALIPAHAEIAATRGRVAAQRFVGAIATWTSIIAVLLALTLLILPGAGIALVGPGLSPPAKESAVGFLPLLLPLVVLGTLSQVLGAICQIAGRFGPIALSWLIGPAISLAVAVLAWDRLGLAAVAVGMTVGSAAGVGLMIVAAARIGALPPVTFRVPRAEVVGFLRHAGPLTAGGALLQFNLVADRAIASLLSVGAVSVLKFGQQLVTEPLGSLSSAWTTSLYPSLVRSGVVGANRSLGALSSLALRYTLSIFVPISFGVAALAPLLVDVVYRRGAFDARAAADTALVVAAFSPMLALTMIQPVLTGAHNARRNGVLLAVTAVSNATFNLVLNLVLGRLFGVAGVALSTSITLTMLLLFLGWRLARAESDFDRRGVLRVGGRVLLASAVPAFVVALIAWNVIGASLDAPANLLALAILGMAGAVGYLVMTIVLGVREPTEILERAIGSIRSWAKR